MKFFGKLLVTALAAIIAANLLPGVSISGGLTALLLAVVLAVLNAIVKPILVILTIPRYHRFAWVIFACYQYAYH